MNIYWITQINKKKLHKTSRIELADALRKRSHTVKLIVEKNIGEKHEISDNIFYIPTIPCRILSRFLFNMNIFFYFSLITIKEKIDVVIIDGGNVYLPFTLTLKLLGKPLILDIRTLPLGDKKTIEKFWFNISLYLSKYMVNGLTTITPELKETLVERYRLKDSKIGIWTSGVSLKLFKKPLNTTINNQFSRDPQYFYLMYHGGYSTTRGIEDLIESISELEDSLKDKIKLIIIGMDSRKKNDLAELGNKLNLNKNLEFVSPVEYEKIPILIDSCNVGIIPLPPKNIWWAVSAPLKTLEYLAMGKPIIATDIPFHRRIFDKGKCGLLIESNDKKTLARAITEMYHARETLEKMGAEGRRIVEKYYTWENSAQDLEEFIKKIL